MSEPEPTPTSDELARRLDLLERENDRLRRQVEHWVGPDNPCFDRVAFMRAMWFYMVVLMVPLYLLFVPLLLVPAFSASIARMPMIGPVPLLSLAGVGSSHPGIGLGIIAFGGLALGVVALGGGAVGVVAMGGGAIGVLAFGGGAIGVIALGGGAVGYIAIGGGAIGRYALGGNARGKAALSLRRQDPEAVAFFVRWFPRLKAAFTTPLPVVPLDENEQPHA